MSNAYLRNKVRSTEHYTANVKAGKNWETEVDQAANLRVALA